MKYVLLASALLGATLVAPALGATDMDGTWARGDGNAKVKIVPCGADICAINTWIKPGTPSEKAGDKLVMTLKPAESGSYSGTAFDPQRNMSYGISVSVDGDKMVTTGCVLAGIVCKDVSWTRIN